MHILMSARCYFNLVVDGEEGRFVLQRGQPRLGHGRVPRGVGKRLVRRGRDRGTVGVQTITSIGVVRVECLLSYEFTNNIC